MHWCIQTGRKWDRRKNRDQAQNTIKDHARNNGDNRSQPLSCLKCNVRASIQFHTTHLLPVPFSGHGSIQCEHAMNATEHYLSGLPQDVATVDGEYDSLWCPVVEALDVRRSFQSECSG